MEILSEILSSKIRAEIFRLIFGIRAEELYMREIERCSGFSIGTIQTELRKLQRLELIKKRKDGNRVYFRANREHPLYADIRNLVLKTNGLADILREALEKDTAVKIAFIFGSIARRNEHAASDVDLMVLGDLGLRELSALLDGISQQVGREINPHVLRIKEFKDKRAGKNSFVSRVFKEPKIFITGTESDLKAMV